MLAPSTGILSSGRRLHLVAVIAGSLLLFTTFYYLRGNAYHWPTSGPQAALSNGKSLEVEGLKLGLPFNASNGTVNTGYLDTLLESLQSRFAKTTRDKAQYPTCNPNYERYRGTAIQPEKAPKRDSVVSFAINVHNSEDIIPAQAVALIEAIGQLIKHNKIYVSVFENGSGDHTQSLLSDFAAALEAMGVDGLWVHTSHLDSAYNTLDRIVVLSEIRNLALAPLIPYAAGQAHSTLVFINDVVMCASDVLELVHQQRLQHADIAVGIDWGTVEDENFDPARDVTRLYDLWVLRGSNGDLPYPFKKDGGYTPQSLSGDWVHDVFSTQEESLHTRWLDGRPIPIYSGWGGMAAFNASLFTASHLRFRSSQISGWDGGSSSGALSDWGTLLSREGYLASDCPGASECQYVARDIWNLRQGQARMLLAPQARTTYKVKDWKVMQRLAPATRRVSEGEEKLDMIAWSEVGPPSEVVCIPSRGKYGELVNQWDESNIRQKLNPMYKDHEAETGP